ncbi:MAG: VOC family protein [Gemmatimonadales bacterium]
MTSNPVGWFEIYVQDMARSQRFYEHVLGLKLDSLPMPEGEGPTIEMLAFPMDMEATGSAGALVMADGFPSGGNSTLVYFNCDDVAVEAGRVASAGGRLEREKMSIGQYGFIALAFDTEGNMFGLHSLK